ncbi:MAG: hypothetical protein ACR2KV_01795 [Solirubrobacteraceae bacterium]
MGTSGALLIDRVVAYLDYRQEQSYTVGDHEIFIGECPTCTSSTAPSLLFHGGQYRFLREAGP